MRMLRGRGNAAASLAGRWGCRGWVPLVRAFGVGWPGSGRYTFWGCLIGVGARSTWLIDFCRVLSIDCGKFNWGGRLVLFFLGGGLIS